ncbi:hypothetical protein PMYN1_Chma779 (chromatophore) [Paulinella micropora]|uniref:DUF565 domain-containing protein n=1 Tax=Paulinella micropora TaxID=1928728 RepID=A0A1L5YD14_9EUKA|nr:hypothetical protein PMNZ_844 [Paulinella micropora]APP88597.1 hypothetical protein PCKR_837 [Paulinella micropora]AQX45364.1 hypothetical protein PFK_837 [Paulinella micropora]AXY63759.1 hypothetical protein PMNZ_844 [Paulinella micropora]BBL86584.1 hypothetical protein PMYN1_Chma779 [Paulinella micropora]
MLVSSRTLLTTLQNTRLKRIQRRIASELLKFFSNNWRYRSLYLLSLLVGFYIGSSLTVYYLEGIGQRPLVSLLMVIIIESLVRLRIRASYRPRSILWLLLDNLRIGASYAVILEAFKVGS